MPSTKSCQCMQTPGAWQPFPSMVLLPFSAFPTVPNPGLYKYSLEKLDEERANTWLTPSGSTEATMSAVHDFLETMLMRERRRGSICITGVLNLICTLRRCQRSARSGVLLKMTMQQSPWLNKNTQPVTFLLNCKSESSQLMLQQNSEGKATSQGTFLY